MFYDICVKTTSQAALIASLAPLGLTAIDEDGTEHLKIDSTEHAVAYVGQIIDVPAVIDPETRRITTPATYLPGEYAILRAGVDLLAQVAAVVKVVEPPAGCPTFGEWRPVPVVDAAAVLAAAKTTACNALDAEAERLRNTVLTPGAGQMAAYQEKERQARALLADPTPTEAEYPDIYNEIGITADSAGEVAMAVLAAAERWRIYGRQVERARLAAKKAVDGAGDEAGILAARDEAAWPRNGCPALKTPGD
jgi:hypothetical protein